MKISVLRNYARLIARTGVNIQKGQDVIIRCDLDQPKFVELLVDECYKAGARKVKVEFSYQPLEKLHVRHQTVTTMAKVEEWEKARLRHYVDTLPCRIYLVSEDPDDPTTMRWKISTSGASRPSPARPGQRRSSRAFRKAKPLKSSGK